MTIGEKNQTATTLTTSDNDAALLEIDFHYEMDTPGSKDENTK